MIHGDSRGLDFEIPWAPLYFIYPSQKGYRALLRLRKTGGTMPVMRTLRERWETLTWHRATVRNELFLRYWGCSSLSISGNGHSPFLPAYVCMWIYSEKISNTERSK